MEIDHHSHSARAYQELFKQKLEEYRSKNDGADLTEAQTNQLRGAIRLLKELIALPRQREIEEAQSRIEHPD